MYSINLCRFLTRSGRKEESEIILPTASSPPFRAATRNGTLSSPSPFLPPSPPGRPAQVTMYPISDLTTFCRRALGDVPPKLVVRAHSFISSSCVILISVSRAHPPPSSVPRFIYMYGPTPLMLYVTDSDPPLPQGGRLVAERRMVTDIYMFDIETFTWEKVPQSPDSDQPRARYFHSTDVCESPDVD